MFASDRSVTNDSFLDSKEEKTGRTVVTFMVTAHLPCGQPAADLPFISPTQLLLEDRDLNAKARSDLLLSG